MASENTGKRVKHLLEGCLEAAKRQDYTAALAAVNDALKAHSADKSISLIHILEHRVAVYLRMSLPDLALKDAKTMIRLDPEDARGYIRSGIAQCRKNDKPAAMKYFEFGLKKVPITDANYRLLVKERKETAEQMKTEIVLSQAKDPLSVLPVEVIEIVVSFLDYRSNIRLLRVSRSWNKIVSSLPPLVDTLAFPNHAKPITTKYLSAAIQRCRALKTVKLTHAPPSSADYLARTLAHCERFPALQYIEWRVVDRWPYWLSVSQYDLRVIIVECLAGVITLPWIDCVLRNYRSLEVAKFQDVSGLIIPEISLQSNSLQEFELFCDRRARLDYGRLSFNFPKLRKLSCKGLRRTGTTISHTLDLSHMTKLQSLNLVTAQVHSIRLPPALRHLMFDSCTFIDQPCDPALPYPTLNDLEELRLDDCDVFPTFLLPSVHKTTPGKLLIFSVTANDQVAQHLPSIMSIPWFQGLKTLRIVNAHFINQYGFPYIKSCQALEELCLEQAGNIGAAVSDLITEAAHLRKVTLIQCPNVARDIIAWAKERGVEVEISQHAITTGSGRRVVETY